MATWVISRNTNIEMAKQCDHTSVGMLVWRDGKLLLIERKKFPPGFAAPAGHVDGDADYETSARRELREEVGLEAGDMMLLREGRRENPCRREGGTWHYWKIYRAEVDASCEVVRSQDETKRAEWCSGERIRALAARTEAYLRGEVPEEDWGKDPGLEPVWYAWLKELDII